MSILSTLQGSVDRLLADPAPEIAFEITADGLAYSLRLQAPQWQPYKGETLRISPIEDNILRTDSFLEAIRAAAGPDQGRKRRKAVLILPDYAARLAVVDFDQFPGSTEEQIALIRFRLKKTVPFDVDAAAISYHVQQRPGSKNLDVLVSLISLEILAKYEAPFRAAGLWPGRVTVSSLAALDLLPEMTGCRVFVRLMGHVLTVVVTVDGHIRLLRCVELSTADEAEIGDVLYPTLAYLEDEWKRKPDGVYLCGLSHLPFDLELPVEPLTSPWGTPTPLNAGLLGYMAAGGRN